MIRLGTSLLCIFVPLSFQSGVALGSILTTPQVIRGDIKVERESQSVRITQRSQCAVMRWDHLFTGASKHVVFLLPNSNSITVVQDMSGKSTSIGGDVSSNGSIYFLNADGFVIEEGISVDTSGDLTITNSDQGGGCGAESPTLALGKQSEGSIVNHGILRARSGDVALVANEVKNRGVIKAESVEIHTKSELARTWAIESSGAIEASGASALAGRIIFAAHRGNIRIGGKLRAFKRNGDGGSIFVGGNRSYALQKQIPNALNTIVQEGATIDVSAASLWGNGGTIVLWADHQTSFHGRIRARAGILGGRGGVVEVSGKQRLQYEGLADLRAPSDNDGHLRLDPTNVEIKDGVGQQNVSGPAGNKIGSNGTSPTIINAATINTQLGLGDLTIETNAAGAEPGNIIVTSAINWSSNNTLSFDAHNSIILNASVTSTGLSAILNLYDFNGASRGAGDITSAPGTTLSASEINVATAGNVSLEGVVIAGVFRLPGSVNGIGGSLSAENPDNAISELRFGSSTRQSGNVSVFDSTGGMTIGFSVLDTLGTVTLRTVGDMQLAPGVVMTTAGNIRLEALGGAVVADATATLVASRYLIYADTFTQGGIAAPDSTEFADYPEDSVGSGNVFYQPSASASNDPAPAPESGCAITQPEIGSFLFVVFLFLLYVRPPKQRRHELV